MSNIHMENEAPEKTNAISVGPLQGWSSYLTTSEGVYYSAAIAIFCLAIGLRLVGLDKGIWLDEYYSIRNTFSIGCGTHGRVIS